MSLRSWETRKLISPKSSRLLLTNPHLPLGVVTGSGFRSQGWEHRVRCSQHQRLIVARNTSHRSGTTVYHAQERLSVTLALFVRPAASSSGTLAVAVHVAPLPM